MKILIVDDNVSNRLLIQKVLKKNGYDIISASNGEEAFAIAITQKPDMIITDWMMPKLDGLELIKKIKKEILNPPPIIMITAIASYDAQEKILNEGADAFLTKPQNNDELISIVQKLSEEKRNGKEAKIKQKLGTSAKSNLIGIGIAASTGGPPTLSKLFSEMLPLPNTVILVVLHGPAWMLESFSAKMDMITRFDFLLAEDGQKIEAGKAYLAPGDLHMVINPKSLKINLLDTEPVNFVKPSADPLFQSIAQTFREKSIGVVLTGMGKDGTVGAGYIKAAGGYVIAENPETAILHSMPKSVVDMRLANKVVNIDKAASEIINAVQMIK